MLTAGASRLGLGWEGKIEVKAENVDLQDGAACGEGDKLGDGGVVAEPDPAGVIIHCAQPGQKKDQADGDPEASDKIPFVF